MQSVEQHSVCDTAVSLCRVPVIARNPDNPQSPCRALFPCDYNYHMQQMPLKTLAHDNTSEVSETTTERLATLTLETIPVVMRTIRTLMRAGAGKDLTVPQFRALGFIDRHRGTSLKAVADHLGMSMPGTSRLIDALVQRNLVERTLATDRRYVTLNLLPAGEQARAVARQRTQQGLAAMLQRLTPAERKSLMKALPVLRDLFGGDAPHVASAAPPQTPEVSSA